MKLPFKVEYLTMAIMMVILLSLVGLHCRKGPETGHEGSWAYTHTTTPLITETTEDAVFHGKVRVIEAEVESETGDTAIIIVSVDPETREVAVTGEINGSPIVAADIRVIVPETPMAQEEYGNVAAILALPLGEAETPLVGLHYSPLHLMRGRLRFGLVGMVGVRDLEESTIGVTVGGRYRNLGLNVVTGVNTKLESSTSVGLSFYI